MRPRAIILAILTFLLASTPLRERHPREEANLKTYGAS